MRTHWPQHVWRFFKAVQHAFYADARDVSQRSMLAEIAEQQGLPRGNFETAFDSEEMREAARLDFAQTQAWGIRGFPAVIAEAGGSLHMVAQGYLPVEALRERLAALLREHAH